MANRKINASDVNIPSISLVQQSSDPAVLATRLQLYAYNNLLRLMRTDGTVQTMVDLLTAQTLVNKTLTSPTINTPAITDPTLDGSVILSDTGGSGHFLKQTSLGAVVTSGTIAQSDLPASIGAKVYNNANISVVNAGSGTVLTFNTQSQVTAGMYSAGQPSRLTAVVTGWHHASATVVFDANATGYRQLVFTNNSGSIVGQIRIPAVSGDFSVVSLSQNVYLSSGDYLTLTAYQNSGGALNAMTFGTYSPSFNLAAF